MTEAIIEPDLPIIDPHHHLWDLRPLMPAFPEPRTVHASSDATQGRRRTMTQNKRTGPHLN